MLLRKVVGLDNLDNGFLRLAHIWLNPFVLAALGLSLFLPNIVWVYKQWQAPDKWFTVAQVYVPDHTEGEVPVLDVDRTIHRDFNGTWVAEIQRQVGTGKWGNVCSGNGTNHYSVEDTLPEPVTMDWWTFPAKCRPKAGRYRLFTTWVIRPDNYPTKRVIATSNTFTVKAP